MATSSPPGPILQWINRFLHQDPVDKIAYAIYWCLFLAILSPVAILVLQVQVAIQLLVHLGNWNGRNACHPATKDSDNTAHRLAVVITGCDCGFGREIALKCADAGFVVFAGCLSVDGVGQLQDSPNIIALKMDVTNDNEVNAAVKTVSEWLKGNDDGDESTGRRESRSLHALINNAGVGAGGEVDWIDLSDFQWCIDGKSFAWTCAVYQFISVVALTISIFPLRSVEIENAVNYIGMVRCCKAFLPLFKEQAFNKTYEYARIFNLSSMAGMISGSPGLAAYHASKHAAVAFSTCLRIELKAFGIQVTTINPSYHNTPLTNTMYLRADRMWETLSPRLKAEYGQGMHCMGLVTCHVVSSIFYFRFTGCSILQSLEISCRGRST